VERAIRAARHEGEWLALEYRVTWPDGSVHWIEAAGRYRFDAQGQPDVLLGVTMDIDGRKRAETERNRLFEYAVDMLCITDPDGAFLQVNPACSRILGWQPEDMVGQNWFAFTHPDEQEANEAIARRLDAGEAVENHVNRYRCRDGTYRWLAWNTFPFHEEDELFAAARDVTEQRQLEEQLRQALKMEAVGQLAGGVAHDFNNLLQVINGYSDMVLSDLEEDHASRQYVTEVARAGNRAARLVSQLLAFSRRQVLEPEDMDLNEVIAGLLDMARRTLGEHISVDWRPGEDLGCIHADRGQIEQVLMNLWINARDAMPDGGALTVATDNVTVDRDVRRRHPWSRPGRFVRLTVADAGTGMDARTVERIWEPFFTTKEPGKGTGLGLSTVYGIVRQHDGLIHLESEPGRGSTFEIYLPLVDRVPAPPGERPVPGTTGGHERILVAEDSERVRELVCTILGRAGYDVVAVRDGEEARAYLEEHGEQVDLALVDVVMPGLGGRELHAAVRERLPDLDFLFTSGYGLDAVESGFVLDDGVELIQKPFEATALLTRVRQILERR
jgi:PAS domain S-box-containing protein